RTGGWTERDGVPCRAASRGPDSRDDLRHGSGCLENVPWKPQVGCGRTRGQRPPRSRPGDLPGPSAVGPHRGCACESLRGVLESEERRPLGVRRSPYRRGPGRTARGRHDLVGDPRDRKSTRLNSSHVKISYAVFCLKKKKKTTAR